MQPAGDQCSRPRSGQPTANTTAPRCMSFWADAGLFYCSCPPLYPSPRPRRRARRTTVDDWDDDERVRPVMWDSAACCYVCGCISACTSLSAACLCLMLCVDCSCVAFQTHSHHTHTHTHTRRTRRRRFIDCSLLFFRQVI